MGIGQALKEARTYHGFTQMDLGDELFVSRSTIAMVETGQRDLPEEAVPVAVGKLDCGFLAMEVAAQYTGGAFVSKLNGDIVDLHRASVKEKTIEELHEALDAIRTVRLANLPDRISDKDRDQLEASLLQVIDAIWALTHYVAVICREYRFSWLSLWNRHRKKLKDSGYIK